MVTVTVTNKATKKISTPVVKTGGNFATISATYGFALIDRV